MREIAWSQRRYWTCAAIVPEIRRRGQHRSTIPPGWSATLPLLIFPLEKSGRRRRLGGADGVHHRNEYLFQIHAGVVSNGQKCLLLPAAPGSGKTTLTAALTAAGFQYFSDEVALLEEPDLEVRSVPISLSVKSGALEVLAPLFPQLRRSANHTREDFETVTYLNPPSVSFRSDLNQTHPAGWIVFPRPIGKAGSSRPSHGGNPGCRKAPGQARSAQFGAVDPTRGVLRIT